MNIEKLKKSLIVSLPYVIVGMLCTNIGEAWRIAEGTDYSAKLFSFFEALGTAFCNPLPSFRLFELTVGVICGIVLRTAVYLKSKNAKNYKHNEEYGSARWSA